MRKQMATAMASLAASAAVLTFAYIGVANAGNEHRQLTDSAASLLLHEGMSDAVPAPCLKDCSLSQAETIYECGLAALSDVRFVKINLSINMRGVAIASDLDEDVGLRVRVSSTYRRGTTSPCGGRMEISCDS